MNQTVKSLLKKLLTFVVVFLIIELILVMLIELLFLFAEQRLDINTNMVIDQLTNVLQNPLSVIQSYMSDTNPLFIIGTLVNGMYSLVVATKKKRKNNDDWEIQQEGYHGTAHWGKINQTVDKKNFRKESKRTIQNDFMDSLTIEKSDQGGS